MYAVSHAQQEEVHRKELLEIERQLNELRRKEQEAQQQEVQIQQQEVQIQQQDLDRNHHQIERQNQVQVQLQQRPGKQQGLLEQNQQQQFIFHNSNSFTKISLCYNSNRKDSNSDFRNDECLYSN